MVINMNRVIEEKLMIIIRNKISKNLTITEETDLINDLCLDSLMVLNIIMEIEKRFDILLVDDSKTLEAFKKFSSLVNLIEEEFSF